MTEKQKTEDKNEDSLKSYKYAIYILGSIVLVFVVLMLFRGKGGEVITIDDAHERTLLGEETENNYLYNGYTFVKIGPMWYTRFEIDNQPYDIPFRYDPRSVENIY